MNNINLETGIRFGVTPGNKAYDLMEKIIQHGEDLELEFYRKDILKNLMDSFLKNGTSEVAAKELAKEALTKLDGNMSLTDEPNFSYMDKKGNEFQLGYLVGSPIIWCIKTSLIVKVKSLCSPYVPNAGDLDSGFSDDGYPCYGVPDEYLFDRIL